MSVAQAMSMPVRSSSRWLLLGSLALNLFFIGLGIAQWVRGPEVLDRSPAARVERLAAALPAGDAEKLRIEYSTKSGAFDDNRRVFESAREAVRAALRREPFDADAMRAAMAQMRSARQNFDQVLQGVITDAAGKMSADGRRKMAAYSPPNRQPAR